MSHDDKEIFPSFIAFVGYYYINGKSNLHSMLLPISNSHSEYQYASGDSKCSIYDFVKIVLLC